MQLWYLFSVVICQGAAPRVWLELTGYTPDCLLCLTPSTASARTLVLWPGLCVHINQAKSVTQLHLWGMHTTRACMWCSNVRPTAATIVNRRVGGILRSQQYATHAWIRLHSLASVHYGHTSNWLHWRQKWTGMGVGGETTLDYESSWIGSSRESGMWGICPFCLSRESEGEWEQFNWLHWHKKVWISGWELGGGDKTWLWNWNSLPLNCRPAPSVNTFKIRLKTFLFDSA